MKKPKKQSDKEFLEKIKTLNFNVGAKPEAKCVNCGEPLGKHKLKLIAVGGIMKRKPEENKLDTSNEEVAFSA